MSTRLHMRCKEQLPSGRFFYSYGVYDSYGRLMAQDGSSDPHALLEQALEDLAVYHRLEKMGHDISEIPSWPDVLEQGRKRDGGA